MKSLIDVFVLVILYFAILYPRWRNLSKPALYVNTIFYIYLSAVLYFTLMPIIISLPFIFNHPYIPMNLEPFIDVTLSRGDFMQQIFLNIALTIPFGFLFPLTKKLLSVTKTPVKNASEPSCNSAVKNASRSPKNQPPTFLKTLFYVFLLSLTIELIQPLISSSRHSDITDIITNLLGGAVGYILYIICKPLTTKIFAALNSPEN